MLNDIIEHLTSDEQVLLGKLCIRGTRVSATYVAGLPNDDIPEFMSEREHINQYHIKACREYYAILQRYADNNFAIVEEHGIYYVIIINYEFWHKNFVDLFVWCHVNLEIGLTGDMSGFIISNKADAVKFKIQWN